jgi:tetratricopeptide (TPR) repeat protein
MLYGIAFLEGEAAAMGQQVERAAGTPTEAGMLATQAVTAAYGGQVGRARELTRRAIDLAVQGGLKEGAGLYSAGDALWDAAYGDCRSAKQAAARTLAMTRGRRPLSWSALAMALCGDSSQARQLADEMARRYPQDSFFKTSWLPMVHAALAIHGNDPAAAVGHLQPAGRVELGSNVALWPAYLRGLAYLDRGAHGEARAEFQKILDHRFVLAPKDFNPVAMTLYPLARLGRARAAARAGDLDGSRKDYEALFSLWKDADADIPALRAARREHRQLIASWSGG